MRLAGDHHAVTVLVGGHESDHGADLVPLLDALPGAVATPAGRALDDAVTTLLRGGEASSGRTVLVLPMTWGRDPAMVADAAQTLSWLSRSGAGRVGLCEELGTPDHLVSWLRRAATRTARERPGAGVLVVAGAANPVDDADLHRAAHLVRAHGAGTAVEVACLSGPGDLARAVERCLLLGSEEVVVVPAGFARRPPDRLPEHATFYGPLLSRQALLDVVRRRLAAARRELGHGRDGIAEGLLADHAHGSAHSHAFETEPGHTHHAHPHPHHHEAGA